MINMSKVFFSLLYPNHNEESETFLYDMDMEDWIRITRYARAVGLGPLLYHRLAAQGLSGCVPPRILRELGRGFEITGDQNRERLWQLSRICDACSEKEIPLIPLKGIHLLNVVYGNLALRPMGDTDILIQGSDLAAAEEVLLSLGYVSTVANAWNAKHMIDKAYTQLFPGLKMCVEVHWDLLAQCGVIKLDIDEVWSRTRKELIAGRKLISLSPEDLLLHLCLHCARKHLFRAQLRGICDIAETVRRYEADLDWDLVADAARRWGVAGYVYLALKVAWEFTGAPVPVEALVAVRPDDFDDNLVSCAKQSLFYIPKRHGVPAPPQLGNLEALASSECAFGSQPSERVRVIGRVIDLNGRGVEGVDVLCKTRKRVDVAYAKSDEAGKFEFDINVSLAGYIFQGFHPELKTHEHGFYAVDENGRDDIVLAAFQPGSISGTVAGGEARSHARVTVSVVPLQMNVGSVDHADVFPVAPHGGGNVHIALRTGEDGSFKIDGLYPGEYRLACLTADGPAGTRDICIDDGEDREGVTLNLSESGVCEVSS